MATVTAGALIVAGLRRADMRDSVTGFIKHPASGGGEAFDMLNAALSELSDIVNEASDAPPKTTKTAFNTIASTADYALDTTFYHLRGVDIFENGEWKQLERANQSERNDYPQAGRPLKYLVDGDNLTLLPTPNAIYSMRRIFDPLPVEMTADVDTIDLKGPWREFVELHFAIQCHEKERTDASDKRIRLYGPNQDGSGGLAQRIRNAAKRRDSSAPTAPVDVMGDYDPQVGGW